MILATKLSLQGVRLPVAVAAAEADVDSSTGKARLRTQGSARASIRDTGRDIRTGADPDSINNPLILLVPARGVEPLTY